ncbi:MAG: protein arginine kinase [Kiritimatiellae bacterium]|nr:protein arginine kinase [Kiritimatiellia bacterium]
MKLDDLLSSPGAWLAPDRQTGVVVSSRIRLARNLQDSAFPGWAGEEECLRIWQRLRPVLQGLTTLGTSIAIGMEEMDDLDRQLLLERRLVSREHIERRRGSGLVVRIDETVSIMVNEEDHLRLQAMQAGLRLQETWKQLDAVDSEIEGHVRYAFSPRLGYLTACPTNVGTGLRASVMLHLPGLVLINEIAGIVNGMGKIGLAVRGLWGEGTEATGNMFQISNQMTLGEKEEEIIQGLEQVVREIVEHEKNARLRLMEEKEALVRDHVGRALGILSNAHLLTSKEALDLLSGLRLGSELGIFDGVGRDVIDELLLQTQPAHLQKMQGKQLNAVERDQARAELVRSRLAEKRKRPKGNKDV